MSSPIASKITGPVIASVALVLPVTVSQRTLAPRHFLALDRRQPGLALRPVGSS